VSDDLECRFCGRPCANGTGRAAHERHCSQRESPAVCKRCHEDYPRGELDAHLRVCSASATSKIGPTKPGGAVLREERERRTNAGELVITVTMSGSPRQMEEALRKLRA
jgi:hypothetical protein